MHYKQTCESSHPSVRGQLVKMPRALEPRDIYIFLSNFAYLNMSTLSNHWHTKQPFYVGRGFAVSLARRGQLVKMLITLETHAIFE